MSGAASERVGRWGLAVVLAGYVVLATLYAVLTPPWQAPDEPAHFNYVRQVAAHPLQPPEIGPGDYPYQYLEDLKRTGFPPDKSIDSIDYEDHQAPVWYYLALPFYLLAPPSELARLMALRLMNVAIGAIGVWLVWRTVRMGWPADPLLAIGAAAFAAFLPMRLAIVSAATNDPLAEVLSTAAIWLALSRAGGRLNQRRWVVGGGLLLACALLTKVSAYGAAGVLAAGEGLAWWRRQRFGTALAAATVAQQWGLGLIIALPWFLRNTRIYGGGDWMGRARHDAVVTGQPTTAGWITAHGLFGTPDALLNRMVTFTFESFWGVFGWMGVFLDTRYYQLLAVASVAAVLGCVVYLIALARRADAAADGERNAVTLLGLAVVISAAGFVWWNLTFVQHQGRYLFPALVAFAAFFMLGLRELATRLADGVGLGDYRRLAEGVVLLGFSAGLASLAAVSLFRFIVPQLH